MLSGPGAGGDGRARLLPGRTDRGALLPELRTAIGDDRRVLIGFDRGGWSRELFADMEAAGFDVLT